MKVNRFIYLSLLLLSIFGVTVILFDKQNANKEVCIDIVRSLSKSSSQTTGDLNVQTKTNGYWSPLVDISNVNEVTFKLMLDESLFKKEFKDKNAKNSVQRIQVNLYSLKDRPKIIKNNFTFELSSELSSAINSNVEFRWFTIFELWNEPGWIHSEYPFRVSLNLIKTANSNYLTPVLTGQYKNYDRNVWVTVWEKNIDMKVVPEAKYQFGILLDIDNKPNIKMKITDLDNDDIVNVEVTSKLQHPKNNSGVGIWGVNPIKLYTGSKVLEAVLEKNSRVAVKFSDAEVCYK